MNTLINALKRNGFYLISIMLFVASVQSAALAQMSTLNKGDRIRILASSVHSKSIVGTVYDVSTTGVLLSSKDSSLTIPFSSINRVDVSRGTKRSIGKGALVGLGIGVLAGGLTGAISYKECNEEGLFACFMVPESRGEAFRWGATAGGVAGLVLGTIVGVFTKTDKWERMPVEVSVGFNDPLSQKLLLNPSVSLKFSLDRKH